MSKHANHALAHNLLFWFLVVTVAAPFGAIEHYFRTPFWVCFIVGMLIAVVIRCVLLFSDYARRLTIRLEFEIARMRTGYGPIRLHSGYDGALMVSVMRGKQWVPIIIEYRDIGECSIDHSISETGILEEFSRVPFEETDVDVYYHRRTIIRRHKRRRNP